jgi:DNA-directed RNA polymerase beta' subunit
MLVLVCFSQEDDLTIKLADIVHINDIIRKNRTDGAKIQMLVVSLKLQTTYCVMLV